ncbi:gliding motility lipoprotein GldJ [Flavobacteriaceae bacterium]|nr:gliding motility lipoprotein GldJ [Flavobacteriaceae bacterium]MDB4050057.1 gliding motility lipoprotein GldJ [Flavobacteriaceae bacterium]MDB9901790.1 gliding motility lipoprotein GldJ [Flavobacteriaceae bacterium]MDC0958626.1 gliding motility lipoprotein GldJ [Flavobacteriaceae bacterium]
MKVKYTYITLVLLLSIIITGCNSNNPFKNNKNTSQGYGWKISTKDGGFRNTQSFTGQNTGPGLVYIEGGTYTKGNVQDNIMRDWNNTPTQQYVRSFFIDETEVTNLMYVEYLYWMNKVFAKDFPDIYKAALPDTLVWRNPLGSNEDMVNNYLRHPAFENHPVVGVNWKQATNYAKWRSDRVNEQILVLNGYIRAGAINPDSLSNGYSFNTKAYYLDPSNVFNGKMNEMTGSKRINTDESGETTINYATRESGILLPEYRLPTETEWEYAALALSEISKENLYRGKKKFPWEGEYTRSGKRKNMGDQLANFKLGKGDYGGIAGWSETGAGITSEVRAYPPNDFGLFGMAGNVAEWVADVYRPIIDEEMNDLNYFRGNLYYKSSIGKNGKVLTVSSENANYDNLPGSLKNEIEDDNSINRTNYSKGDNRDFNDGDSSSVRDFNLDGEYSRMYNSPEKNNQFEESTTLINNEARVYKGGSWLDRAYYLDPAQRRYYPESMTSNFIGFRCAMSYLGGPRSSKKSRKR